MKNKTLSPQLDRGYTPEGRSNALLAATMSQKQSRQRADSTPTAPPALYPDQANSAHNALNAATVSSRNSVRNRPNTATDGLGYNSPAMQAARVQNLGPNVSADMWGEHPPVEIEVSEKKHQEALRASAVVMAKQMYQLQNQKVTTPNPAGNTGAEVAQSRSAAPYAPADLKSEALKYIHLQDAAHKLAQERLAKIDKEHENAKYREHYGYPDSQPSRSRLTMRSGRNRRRDSDAELDSDDEQTARRIRGQQSQLNNTLGDVDAKKQAADRKALLAAAERNVQKSMNRMDDKVFQDTGKVSQTKMDEWAAKARQKAQAESDVRQENHGKTHIGGGRFMEQSEIEAIALARLKPTFDEINETAEKKRARDEELRLDREEQERNKRDKKTQEREEKDEAKKLKNEEKAAAKRAKEERKSVELADRRKSGEQKEHTSLLTRLASKRKSRGAKTGETAAPVSAADEVVADPTVTTAEDAKPVVVAVPIVNEPTSVTSDVDDDATEGPLERVETAHTGHLTDAVPSPTRTRKPDLERHISKIESSGSSLSDWEDPENDEEFIGPIAATVGPSTIPGVHDAEEKDHRAGLPVAAAGASGVAAAQAAPDHDQAHAMEVATRVVSSPVTSAAEPSIVPSTAADTQLDAAPVAAPAILPVTEPAPASTTTTAPTTTSKLQKSADQKASHPSSSTQPTTTTTTDEAPSKGIRGFFSKFRSGGPSTSSKVTKSDPSTAADPKASTSLTSGSSAPATTGVVAPLATKSDAPASPSSFRRHRGDSDVSSLSSSGLDEDDLGAGRSGRVARALKVGGGKGEETETTTGTAGEVEKVGSNQTEQFEEARDHFDEGLAPAPAFAGQAKSHSPARETRFREEV
ncbi:Eisosome assembly protein [Oleoguttula sp. CCFEE 5521]